MTMKVKSLKRKTRKFKHHNRKYENYVSIKMHQINMTRLMEDIDKRLDESTVDHAEVFETENSERS